MAPRGSRDGLRASGHRDVGSGSGTPACAAQKSSPNCPTCSASSTAAAAATERLPMRPAAAPPARSCSTPRRRPAPPAPPLLLGCCALLTCTAALERREHGAANARKQAPVAVQREAIRNLLWGHWVGCWVAAGESQLHTMTNGRRDQRAGSIWAPCGATGSSRVAGLPPPAEPGACAPLGVLLSPRTALRVACSAPDLLQASKSCERCRGGEWG